MNNENQNLPRVPVFCAIDTTDPERAQILADAAMAAGIGLKLGKEFFTSNGPDAVQRITRAGEVPFFLDLKFHDIPNTVAGAIKAACPLNPGIVNVHASGGRAMMAAAAKAAAENSVGARPLIIAVTILTSMDDQDLADVGLAGPVEERAVALAKLAQDSGLDGVVCAPTDITGIRAACGDDFKLIVPGIRPAGVDQGDQKRVLTPRAAMDLGASYLVIGRAISGADDPVSAAQAIAEDLKDFQANG
jgi:orotidine-5'-phosphate decarboxylase